MRYIFLYLLGTSQTLNVVIVLNVELFQVWATEDSHCGLSSHKAVQSGVIMLLTSTMNSITERVQWPKEIQLKCRSKTT